MKSESILNILDKLAESIEPTSSARLAAAVVYKNDIISFGTNKMKSHPFQRRFAKHEAAMYLHAETLAIKNALRHLSLKELSKSILYISRIKWKDSESEPVPNKLIRGMAKPCSGCMRCITTFGISRVCYTTDNDEPEWL